jgi:hypothetical protein
MLAVLQQTAILPLIAEQGSRTVPHMSFDVLKQELASLQREDRRRAIAFLVSLQDSEDAEYQEEIARRLNDRSPESWLTLEQLDARLGTGSK